MNNELDKQNPSHELAHVSAEEVGFGWLAVGGAYAGDTADANANEADDYRDEGREDFGWGGDEALCGE